MLVTQVHSAKHLVSVPDGFPLPSASDWGEKDGNVGTSKSNKDTQKVTQVFPGHKRPFGKPL